MHWHRQKLILAALVGAFSACSAVAADDAIRRLESWRTQRDGWQQYRDEAQKTLNFDRNAMERVRDMADVRAREKEMYAAAKEGLKDSPEALKDSFKRTIEGKPPSIGEIKDDFERLNAVRKELKSMNDAMQADVNQERLQARMEGLQKESAQLEKSIAIAERVIDYSAQQVAVLSSSGEVWFQRLPEWAQAALSKAAAAQQRQETVPAGWEACSCPAQHTAYGRVIKGVRYHPHGPVCPQ